MSGLARSVSTPKRGFTLIELLVVITIIGILITMAVVSFNLIGNDRGVQKEVLRMSSLIELASEEAQMQGRDFGLELMQTGFRFLEYDAFLDAWDEVIGDDILRPRDIAENMEFELKLEDRRIVLQVEAKQTLPDEDSGDRDLTDDYLPHVLILASGDITPFALQIVRLADRSTVGLKLEAGGNLEIMTDEDDL